jgi:F-type H+-transporting ATPase subunit gamma
VDLVDAALVVDKLLARFDEQGTEAKVYLIGRKAKQNFDFRDRAYEQAFEGPS